MHKLISFIVFNLINTFPLIYYFFNNIDSFSEHKRAKVLRICFNKANISTGDGYARFIWDEIPRDSVTYLKIPRNLI